MKAIQQKTSGNSDAAVRARMPLPILAEEQFGHPACVLILAECTLQKVQDSTEKQQEGFVRFLMEIVSSEQLATIRLLLFMTFSSMIQELSLLLGLIPRQKVRGISTRGL